MSPHSTVPVAAPHDDPRSPPNPLLLDCRQSVANQQRRRRRVVRKEIDYCSCCETRDQRSEFPLELIRSPRSFYQKTRWRISRELIPMRILVLTTIFFFFFPPSSQGPRTRKPKKQSGDKTASIGAAAAAATMIGSPAAPTAHTVSANSSDSSCSNTNAANDDKRPRTAFSGPQLARLKVRFLSFTPLVLRNRNHRRWQVQILRWLAGCLSPTRLTLPINARWPATAKGVFAATGHKDKTDWWWVTRRSRILTKIDSS